MQGKSPLVSIATLCYNQEGFLIETLDSIKTQTYSNIEVILLDDYSNDNSVEIIEKWLEENNCSWRFIKHTENQGLCKTANEALSLAGGEYFQIIACDDVLYPDKIERQVNLFSKLHENVSVVCGDLELIDEEGKTTGYDHNTFKDDDVSYTDLLTECIVRAPSVLIKKQIFDVVGNYDERLFFEDWDLWLRIVKKAKIKKDNYVNVKYRMHSSSMWGQKKNKWSLETTFLILEKQLPAQRNHKKIINKHFINHIEHLYVNKRRVFWFYKIMSNRVSIIPVIHLLSSSLGFNYNKGKAVVRFGKNLTRKSR